MMRLLKQSSIAIVCSICWCIGVAQTPIYQANIQLVDATGYYQVQLSPELLGTVVRNCIDLRIKDEKGEEQPYFITQESENSVKQVFIAYPIVRQVIRPGGLSELVFKNNNNEAIDRISLLVNSADVVKELSLSGSDNLQHWFVVKDKDWLHGLGGGNKTTVLKMLRFPKSSYTYFKLTFNDSTSLPLQIKSVGNYNTTSKLTGTTSYQFKEITQVDSAGKTYVQLNAKSNTYLEKLNIYASGTSYFDRNAKVIIKRKELNKKKQPYIVTDVLGSFRLKSDDVNEIKLGRQQLQHYTVVIDNLDDKPLVIDSVVASYKNKYAVVKLTIGEQYTMTWGDENTRKAKYDITKFTDKIRPIATIQHQKVNRINTMSTATINQKQWWQTSTIIWVIIVIVGSLLAFVAFKIVKEIG